MDQLPQELIEKITSYVPTEDLKNLLTLTTKFRYSAERYSGAFTEYTLNKRNADKFVKIFSGHRLLYLREVIFRPNLPPLVWTPPAGEEDEEIECRESAGEIRDKSEHFTCQVQIIYKTLRTVEENAGHHAPGRYRLLVHGPTRLLHDNSITCPHRQYSSWRVQLLNTEMPLVYSVRSLEIYNVCKEDTDICHDSHDYPPDYSSWEGHELKLDLGVMVKLASRLSNLEYMGCKTGGFEWHPPFCHQGGDEEPNRHFQHDWDGPRRDARHDFASAVTRHEAQLPASLRRANLDFVHPLYRTLDTVQDRMLPNLVRPALYDPFSSSLRLLTNNVRQLRIRAIIDESLFHIDDSSQPAWPNLEILEVMFHPSRPDGSWYFHGPRGQGRDAVGYAITAASYPPFEANDLDAEMEGRLHDQSVLVDLPNGHSNEFRITPDEQRLRPLLEGFARAAVQMPSLKRAIIRSPLLWDPTEGYDDGIQRKSLVWGIQYSAEDIGVNMAKHDPTSQREQGYTATRALTWMVGDWHPDAQLHSLFQQIGREKHGEDLVEHWEQKYMYADDFPHWMFINAF
ncbi:unnamed protein product [Alternaria alternata]